jgi:hypothetical protein
VKKEKVLDRIETNIRLFLDLIRFRNCGMTFIAVLLGASFIDFGQVFTIKVLMAGIPDNRRGQHNKRLLRL